MRRGQSTLEYAAIIAIVVAAILGAGVYVQRSIKAKLKLTERLINEDFSSSTGPIYNVCGNGICEVGEDHQSCPGDCVPPSNEDGVCGPDEDCLSSPCDCWKDCQSSFYAKCGDGICATQFCEQIHCKDYDECRGVCGDGYCMSTESRWNCPVDCGLPPQCGDGRCEPLYENKGNCSRDCH